MTKLKQLIGETKAIFASVLCLLSLVLLAPSARAATTSGMDQALDALAQKIAAGGPIAEVYVWEKPHILKPYELVDISDHWTNGTIKTEYNYTDPVIFTGAGALAYNDIKNEMIFGGGLAAPNATSLDLSKKPGDNPVTVKGEFRGGSAADDDGFVLTADYLTLNNVTYRGKVSNITDNGVIKFVGINWDLTGGLEQYGCISHFERYVNTDTTVAQNLLVRTEAEGKQQAGAYVIASGEGLSAKKLTENKSGTFTLKAGEDAGTAITIGGNEVKYQGRNYRLLNVNEKEIALVVYDTKASERLAVTSEMGTESNPCNINTTGDLFENFKSDDTQADFGGAVSVDPNAYAIGSNLTFIANTAAQDGGATYNEGTLTINGTAGFVGNSSEGGMGGAIGNNGRMTINGAARFVGNSAAFFAGAIWNEGALTINGTADFTGNSCTDSFGGAIASASGTLKIDGHATFTGNTANADGGAIWSECPLDINGGATFTDNRTVGEGGAIRVGYYAVTIKGGAIFTGNSAAHAGAIVVCNSDSAVTINDGATFTGNTATTEFGGAIVNYGTVTINDGATFAGNTATQDGGAIFNYGTVTINDGATFTGNTAIQNGGAVWNKGTVVFDGLMDLQTAGDTWYNTENAVVKWDLTGGLEQYGCISHFERYANENATVKQLISVTDDQPVGDYVIATGDFTDVSGKDTFTVKNVTSGATATLKINGVTCLNGTWWYLAIDEDELILSNPPLATLSDVFGIDEETGATNATAVVTAGGFKVEPEADGDYLIPFGLSVKLDYTAAEDYMFVGGAKTKSVNLGMLREDTSMDIDCPELKPVAEAQWVEVREIAIDTRARIVVGSPDEVLPIAYSTNKWGVVKGTGSYSTELTVNGTSLIETNENGYAEWRPDVGAFGQYDVKQEWSVGGQPKSETTKTIYYGADYQLAFDEDRKIFVQYHRTDKYGLGNLEDVMSYTVLQLTAQPEYTNVDRYELAGWKAYAYAEKDNWKDFKECPELAAKFGDVTAVETTFEMPFTNVFLTCSYQWKSNYTDTVHVKSGLGNAWEIHEGETYQQGVTTEAGSLVSARGAVNPVALTLAAGATNLWDFTKNGRPYYKDVKDFSIAADAVNLIRYDETLTNDSYRIASSSTSLPANLDRFLISDGTDEQALVVNDAVWTYVGTKRFKIVGDQGLLTMTVESGSFIVSYDAQGGAWEDGTTVSNIATFVRHGYALPGKEPFCAGYAFHGWYSEPEGAGVAVTNGGLFLAEADHAVYANWTADVTFDQTDYRVLEGGALKVRVCRGDSEGAFQATVTYVRNTGSYSAAYMDGKRVTFPLTLGWSKSDREPKEIVFQTTASAKAEADKTFTLQLSAKVGEGELATLGACTVTIEDAQGGAEAKPYVRALAWPANAGIVSGEGVLANDRSYRTLTATAKSYATFAGWYKAKADDPDVIDLSAPVEPYNPRNPRLIRVGYGSENGAGTYFAYFTNVLAVAAVVEPKAFDETGAPLPGVAGVRWASDGFYLTYVGVKFSLPVDFLDDSGKGSLSVTKLPSGLGYNRKTGRIEGVPTKAGSFNAQFVASNAAGKHTVTYAFAVSEIPSGAVGTFYGVISEEDSDRTGIGSVAFTAGKTGVLSAKVMRRLAGQRSFSVKGYDYIDTDTFGVAMTNSCGEVFEATLQVSDWPEKDVRLVGCAFGGEGKRSTLAYYGETNGTFVATRNAFATSDKDAEAQQVLAAYLGTYDETLYATNGLGEAEQAVGTVQYRVQSNGNVYLAAKVAKTYDGGKAVAPKTFSGTTTGGFLYNKALGIGGCAAALRNGTSLWSTEVLFDFSTRDVTGQARYIRPHADKSVTEPVDVDQQVGEGIK